MLNCTTNPARCVSLPVVSRRGFSLIELVMIIGILMILIGLLLPAIGRSMASTRQTRVLVAVQQASSLVELYAQSSNDHFPIPEVATASEGLLAWTTPLVAKGFVERPEDIDPDGYKRYGRLNIGMSMAMFYDHAKMIPGQTEPQNQQQLTPVRTHEVLYPSLKGLFWTITVNDGQIESLWACGEGLPRGPVAFADGSASVQQCMELLPGRALYIENGIGVPVVSTWFGARGRDKQ